MRNIKEVNVFDRLFITSKISPMKGTIKEANIALKIMEKFNKLKLNIVES